MQAGAKRLAGMILAGGWLALVVSGCGNTDSPTGPEWTSTAPASTPIGDSQDPEGVTSTGGNPPRDTVTTAAATTTTTAVSSEPSATTTAAPPTSTTVTQVATTATEPPAEEEAPLDESAEDGPPTGGDRPAEERALTHPGIVKSNDYWEELEFPDPATPPVKDPERILYAEEQIQKAYFRWYDGIYRRDPEPLWGAVTDSIGYDRGIAAMESMDFTAQPTLEGVEVDVLALYVDHPDCLVAAYEMDISSFRERDLIERTTVMWPHPEYGWRRNISFAWPTLYGDWWANCFLMDRPQYP